MWKGIAQVTPGARLGDIGHAIQTFAESAGYSVVREFCGHGVGARFHEEPQVLHYGRPGTLEELVPGMIFTIEPMINLGRRDIKEDRENRPYDGWTIVTQRPLAVGAVGAHGARHRDRLRGAHRVRRQPAAAGIRARRLGAQPGAP
jgi:methionine aminopeptidase